MSMDGLEPNKRILTNMSIDSQESGEAAGPVNHVVSPALSPVTVYDEQVCFHFSQAKCAVIDDQLMNPSSVDEMKELIRLIESSASSSHQLDAEGKTMLELCRHVISIQHEPLQRSMRPLLFDLMSHPRNNEIFNHPVNPVEVGALDYYEKIAQPMDLGTVKKQLASGSYENRAMIVRDINLVFRNAIVYNPPQHPIHQCAMELAKRFQELMTGLEDKLDKEVRASCNLTESI
jgi:hypothetical protein